MFKVTLIVLCALSTIFSHAKVYTVGVVPQFEPQKLNSIWRPIIFELEKKTSLKFRIETSKHSRV